MKLGLDHFYYVILVLPGVVEAWQEVSWINKVTAGFSSTFSCSSSCSPNCTYTWFFLNRTITGKKLMWTPDGRHSKVDLRCTVLRMPKARVFSTITSTVEIKNPIFVHPSRQNTLPALNTPLDLVCDDDSRSGLLSDPSKRVLWYKDGQKMSLDKKNASLHFDSLLPSDGGLYQCVASVSRQTRVFSRGYLLNFNPWNVSISGPDVILPGRWSIFTCVVSCNINIDCSVRWQFMGGYSQANHVSFGKTELKLTASRSGTSQNITCVAENPAAGRSAEATKVVEVKDPRLSCSEEVQLNGLILIFTLIVVVDSSRF